jgi:hypothetical protein
MVSSMLLVSLGSNSVHTSSFCFFSRIEVIGLTACLASCGVNDTGCLVECALENLVIDEDYLPRFAQRLSVGPSNTVCSHVCVPCIFPFCSPVQDAITYIGNDSSIRVTGTSLCMGLQMEGFLGVRGEELGANICEGSASRLRTFHHLGL